MIAASASANSGPWSTSFYGNQINSDGYRVNNKLAQHDAIGDIRYTTPDLTAYLTLSGDDPTSVKSSCTFIVTLLEKRSKLEAAGSNPLTDCV